MPSDTALTSPDLVIVFAQALTGLGHLRVSHALYHGLPPGVHALLLNSQDESINSIYKVMSVNPALRNVMEFAQQGLPEDISTILLRWYFRRNTRLIAEQLQTILEQHGAKPKTLLVIATHTFLGHELAAIKEKFSRTNKVHVVLVVVVTDDSPQHIWSVGGADLVFVPSEYTKGQLESYHRSHRRMAPTTYVVAPYMVSPALGMECSEIQYSRRIQELDPGRLASIHMAIPISGASVQLLYLEKLIRELKRLSDRFVYQVISQHSPSTNAFLRMMIGKRNVRLHVSYSYREVVDLYEQVYEREVIALEVTKPSEQSFKALLKPRQRGGAILLFSQPVGRQERDNLRFLIRHNLLPTTQEQKTLWRLAISNKPPSESILVHARCWRGLRLPVHSKASAQFIWWAHEHKLFLAMAHFAGFPQSSELGSYGVTTFWKTVNEYLEHNK